MSKTPHVKPAHSSARRALGSFRESTSIAPSHVDLLWRIFGWDFGVTRGGGLQICRDRGVHCVSGPANPPDEHIEHKFIAPVFGAVAHGGVEDAAFALMTSPDDR